MRRMILLAALMALGTTTVVWADVVYQPFKAQLEHFDRLPEAGREFTATIVISAARDATARDLTLAGEGWTVTRWDGSRDLTLAAGGSVRYTFSATLRAGFGPLVLTGEVAGRPWRKSFDLSREAYGGIMPVDSDRLPPRRILPAGGDKFPTPPQFTLAELTAMAATEPPAAPEVEKDRTTCTITGRLVYWHEEERMFVPVNGAIVVVWWQPTGQHQPPYLTDSERTGPDGTFSVEVEDHIDYFFNFKATSNAAQVQDSSISEDDYGWSTGGSQIPAGTTVWPVGDIYPASHVGALHIMSDLTYAHNNFTGLGYDVQHVDVQWPDNGEGGSYYMPYFEEIHLTSDSTWNDGTICHEWGHYWHHHHAHAVEMDYCNGVCDDGDNCGHCGWCPEHDEVAWMEGCANVLSRINTDLIQEWVPFEVVPKPIADVNPDPDCDWDPWYIEFVFAGAVYDMVDDDTGTERDVLNTDVLGTPVYDQLDLEVVDVLNIMTQDCDVDGHQPYRAPGFFRCAAEYLTEMGSPDATLGNLWETAWNWDLQLDEEGPPQIADVTSTFPVNTPTQTSMGGFYWPVPADNMSGIAGYSAALALNSPALPDQVIDTVQPGWWPDDQLSPGTYYFSVIAADRAGNWSWAAQVYGPIIIVAAGPADIAPDTPTGWTAPLVLRSTLAPDSPNPVTQPPFIQGDNVYFNWAERNEGTGPTGNFYDCMFVDGDSVYTSNVRYLAAGNTASSRNVGPRNLDLIGRHTAWVKLDGRQNVPESDENDNIYAKQFVFSPEDLSLGELFTRTDGPPDPVAGQTLLPGGVPFYPNCDGYDIDLAIFPDLVWAVQTNDAKHLALRLYERELGQTGFITPLYESISSADLPAAVLQVPSVTARTAYCLGVAGEAAGVGTYHICREQGTTFALPDTIHGTFTSPDCLDLYVVFNDLDEDAWFSVKLANDSMRPLSLRFFDPGFATGGLNAADFSQQAAPGDTVSHDIFLPHNEMALAVVGRDARPAAPTPYTIFAYRQKPDLVAAIPQGWAANIVPQIGTPYDPVADDVPAPTQLTGGTASTGIYHVLRNQSAGAGVANSLSHRVDLDGVNLFANAFLGPLPPLWELRRTHTSLVTVRGGRHALVHRINYNHNVDEDFYTNNNAGRQWVWSPLGLALNQVSTQPSPPNPYGSLSYVNGGLVTPNCDGYRVSDIHPILEPVIFAAYAVDDVLDVDLGLYTDADVQIGYTTTLTESQWSGTGCDFVLSYLPALALHNHYLGAVLGSGTAGGDYTLCTATSTTVWSDPVGNTERGTVAAGAYLSVLQLSLPPGMYRFTLDSDDEPLGMSLHDLSGDASSKTAHWPGGILWQGEGQEGQNGTFVIIVPSPAPSLFALAVWRPEGTGAAVRARWMVSISADVTGAEDSGQPLPAVSRLVAAAPNPFNPATEISFETAQPGRCELTVHDLRGRLVRTLVASDLPAGRRSERWDGLDDSGQRVSSGVYLARLRAPGGEVDLLKLTLVK